MSRELISTGNELAALAAIELLQTEEIQGNINQVNQHHLAFAERIKKHPKVQTTRVLGVIFALEIKVEGK